MGEIGGMISDKMVVPKAGFEPARVSPPPPQDGVSTRFHHFGIIGLISLAWSVQGPEPAFQPVAPARPGQALALVRPG